MKNEISLFFDLLSAELGTQSLAADHFAELTAEDLRQIYRLSKSHDLAHMVGDALGKLGVSVPEELSGRFLKQQMLAVYRYERINDTFLRLCELLESAEIPYMPLKGSVIRPYYPEGWMRTSCDIDVLVKEADAERAVELVSQAFGIKENFGKSFHDHSLLLSGGVHLELHFNIIEETEPMDTVLRTVWDHALLKEGSGYCYLQSNAFLLFHLVAHNAYHFVKGGCGVRPFVDWWLLKQRLSFDEAEFKALLESAELTEFAAAMDALSDVWFSGKEHTPLTQEMESYILGAGVYGSMENRVTVGNEKSGGKFRYILGRIFMPYRGLKKIYPRLERAPILYPFYTVLRWFRVLFTGQGSRAMHEIRSAATVEDTRTQRVSQMCKDLRLIQ